ncbi:MAG: protein kinase domain-containing protein [Desulfobacterales bacterium]
MNESSSTVFLTPGTVLSGTYQIIRLIGRGGMGAVYMAYDMRLDLKVAVKVISPELAETMDASQYDGILKRFRSEARIAAKIDHPNVIRIFGFMKDTVDFEGRPAEIDFLVMELLAGRTLRDTMDVSGFEHEEEIRGWIVKYMIPILEGLEKVHGSGIIHRDIKPENFFMKGDVAKLADFGLSMGFDLPSVTGSVADIFGTMAYMAPEQFYNFSLAREPADIFAIGRILYEVVEGKMTEKVKPFKQVHLATPETDYLKTLNEIIMAATAENPNERIGSAHELKDRLLQLHYCRLDETPAPRTARRRKWAARILWPAAVMTALSIGALTLHLSQEGEKPAPPAVVSAPEELSDGFFKVTYGTVLPGMKSNVRARDNSILLLIPPMNLELDADNPLGERQIAMDAFYLSENPVTNQQYINFLNANLERIEIVDSDVRFEDRLILKLSEKIRGYKPIVFDGARFRIQDPMHSACAVLMVTGYGAEVYARYHGLRLMNAREWYAVMLTGHHQGESRIPLPTPVINYKQDRHGLRGINQLAEWGDARQDGFVILGQSPSIMIEGEIIIEKDPSKYYTDTSFRVARDAAPK